MAAALVGQLVGRDSSLAGLPERIAHTAGGNPLFVEEVVRDLAGRGVLTGSRGDYQMMGSIAEIAVPATVHAVLAARIDRLPSQAKALLNAAAVIGTRFDLDMLHTLLPEVEPRHLADLVSAELIDQTEFVARQRYCFRHPLVRTVAYESQLIATRIRAHKLLADAIEARDPGSTPDRFVARCDHTQTYRPAVTPDHRKRLVVSSSRHQAASDPSGKPLTRERIQSQTDRARVSRTIPLWRCPNAGCRCWHATPLAL